MWNIQNHIRIRHICLNNEDRTSYEVSLLLQDVTASETPINETHSSKAFLPKDIIIKYFFPIWKKIQALTGIGSRSPHGG